MSDHPPEPSAEQAVALSRQTDEGWIVVRWTDCHGLEAWKLTDEREARAFHDRVQQQWSECFLTRIVRQGAQRDAQSQAECATLRRERDVADARFQQEHASRKGAQAELNLAGRLALANTRRAEQLEQECATLRQQLRELREQYTTKE